MDLVPYLSTVIFVATIATVLLAVFSYAAFKLRDKRKPSGNGAAPVYFHRFRLEGSRPPSRPPENRGPTAASS